MDMASQEAPAPGVPESRTAAFGTGQGEGSLSNDSVRFNTLVPKSFTQTSVLQNPYPTMNGMAQSDYQRILPGMSKPMASPNGTSENTFEQSMLMRLRGQEY